MKTIKNKIRLYLLLSIFGILPIVIITLKFTIWGYSYSKILPKIAYNVVLSLNVNSYGESVDVKTYLPKSNYRQYIDKISHSLGQYNLEEEQSNSGRVNIFSSAGLQGDHEIRVNFTVMAKAVSFRIDSSITTQNIFPPNFDQYLNATPAIQTSHPIINQKYMELVGDEKNILKILHAVHSYTASLIPRPFKGVTDAVTAAKLGEGSCNGKSRLFVALSRKAGIPSRLVGGIILEEGTKTTTHQWVECFINGHWIPFDPLNGYFSYIPSNYLSLYRGDEYLFTHSSDINFTYVYSIEQILTANPSLYQELYSTPINAYKTWEAFDRVGISLELLKLIIILPLGALFVAIFQNVIGLQTFGIFLPALVALSCRQTGIEWGLFGFLLVIGIVSLLHHPLDRYGILYTPKMAIMLTVAVIVFLLISALSIQLGLYKLSYVTLFPIVIVSITAERFGRSVTTEGMRKSLKITFQTLIVITATYFVMSSITMETFFLAFPELFFLLIGINLWLGKWIGFRMTEYYRFRKLLNAQ